MSARRIGIALCVAVLLASGAYVFVYLYRWEWNRALISAAFFLAAEVALGVVAILDRLRALHTEVTGLRAAAPAAEPDPAVLARIRQAAPEPSTPFAWLAPDEARMGVFVPVLMGAGVVLSAVAWLVERVARSTATPTLERGLAARLHALALPDGGLLPAERAPSVLDLR